MNEVILKLEEIRKRKGITKTHVASHCGKTTAWYVDIVKGRRRVYMEDVSAIANSLELEVSFSFSQKVSEMLNLVAVK
ncbi:helix-turn-helix domain-containing protein [Paenibacillus sp. GCM10012307]|uniref:Helix-turn-helix transcriptional regulator n=1 Tax=Paenibacillus roseus TaxID=2798579 RepID=A0A934MQQ4_9BACL|nr:helix-turn-helix transcriptional regulator [Paenibacillus roseus]MBJ6362138.1 helix-turn-helix transcriptional regulator [Paenibacillus roseus]